MDAKSASPDADPPTLFPTHQIFQLRSYNSERRRPTNTYRTALRPRQQNDEDQHQPALQPEKEPQGPFPGSLLCAPNNHGCALE